MSANFVEELVCEYYRLRGYLAMPNYWFPIQTTRRRTQRGNEQEYSARSWSDIDVLAVGAEEVLLVQVKSIVNEVRVVEKIKGFFEQADEFLERSMAPDGKSSIAWWGRDKAFTKLLVYEYYSPPSYLNQLRESGVEVRQFSSYFDEIVEYIRSKSGVKEESPLMRMIHFLNTNGYLPHQGRLTGE